jgi:hypothetical protein
VDTVSGELSVPPSPSAVRPRTTTYPADLLEQIEARLSALQARRKVKFTGFIEAAARELLSHSDDELVEILERHNAGQRRAPR